MYRGNIDKYLNDKELIKTIIELYNKYGSYLNVGQELHMDRDAISKILRTLGVKKLRGKSSLVFYDNYCTIGDKKIEIRDFYQYYLQQNHTIEETSLCFGITFSQVRNITYHYGIKKDPAQWQERITEANRNKTTEEIAEIKRKRKETCREKYGTDYYFQSEEGKEACKASCLKKYGVDNYSKSKEHHDKIDEVVKKRQATIDSKTEEEKEATRQKQSDSHRKYLENRSEEEANKIKEKVKVSIHKYWSQPGVREKFGKMVRDNLKEHPEITAQIIQTKKENHTLNTSKPEEETYLALCEIFGKDNVKREYNTKIEENSDRYPFYCDFYIKPLDLFLELNLYYTHGKHPFNSADPKDLKQLELLKERNYENYIDVWTIRDPKKLACAKEHNLNYKAIYNVKEIPIFLEHLKKGA